MSKKFVNKYKINLLACIFLIVWLSEKLQLFDVLKLLLIFNKSYSSPKGISWVSCAAKAQVAD